MAKTAPSETPHAGPFAGIDPAVARALREVPKEVFAAAELVALESGSGGLVAREGRLIPPREMLIRMIEGLRLEPGDRVLEVGTAVGYATALLSKLAREVFSVEGLGLLADLARRTLPALALPNVFLRQGDALAWREKAPFQAILVSRASAIDPAPLREQLAVGGRLVLLGGTARQPSLIRITRRSPQEFVEESLGQIRFMKRLGDLLVESGAADRAQIEKILRESGPGTRLLGELLCEKAQVPEREVARALAEQRGLRFGTIDLLLPRIDPDLVRSWPRAFLEHQGVIPVRRSEGRIELATPNPDASSLEISPVFHPSVPEIWLVTAADYKRLWAGVDLMLTGAASADALAPARGEEIGVGGEPRLEQRFVDLFESMLLDAIGERASDVHLERYGERVRVRIRVDGDLREVPRYRLAPLDLVGIVNVVKIRANLNIAEHRLPQGGRIRVRAGGKDFDLRVQTQPSLHGEHVVIRILPQDVRLLTIEDLGYSSELAREYRRLLEHPSGLVLAVGPTGSGKTTTLYAGLQVLARDLTRKVITVEDPIEYAIENVQQTQVKPEVGFSFADAMRSFVRQDPDVILVGEIRDSETALEAIRASQTGHLVLSTLHCNDTTDAVQRLIDLGMHPNSIASELLAVLSQRLPRRICPGCRAEAAANAELLGAVFPQGAPDSFRSWKGTGCGRCGGHGAFGRIACVEFLRTNSELRSAISRRPPVEELRRMALEAKLLPLRETALDLVTRGVIAFEELPNLLSWERLAPERRT